MTCGHDFTCSFRQSSKMHLHVYAFYRFCCGFASSCESVFWLHHQVCNFSFLFLKNPPSSASFSLIFCLFKQTIQILQKNVKNFRPVSRARDSNSWPSDFKSPPLFTIPGHQSYFTFRYCIIYFGDECYYLLEQMLLPATYTTFYLLPSTLEQWLTE